MTLSNNIRALRGGIDGETVPKSDVTDVLLDLRLDAADLPNVIEMVDRVLTDMPGKNVVLSSWWSAQLEALALEAEQATATA